MKPHPKLQTDIAVAAIGLVAGLLTAGFFLGQSPPEPEPQVSQGGPLVSVEMAADDLVVEEEEAALPAEAVPSTVEIDYDKVFARLEAAGFAVVPKAMLKRTRHQPIMGNGLSPDVIQLLQLEEEEVEKVNSVISAARARYDGLQRRHARVLSVSPEEVVVRIPPFPEEGMALRQWMESSFTAILGDRDGGLLWEMAMRTDSPWYRFGSEPIELTFYNGTTIYPAPVWLKITHPDPEQFFSGASGMSSAGGFSHIVPLLPREMRQVFSDSDPNRINELLR